MGSVVVSPLINDRVRPGILSPTVARLFEGRFMKQPPRLASSGTGADNEGR